MSRLDPEPLMQVITRLLGPQGCPWDREQTPHSLCEYVVEEVFELVEAVRGKQEEEIREELGDVSFLLFFLAELLNRERGISLQQAWQKSAEKMVRRHPHVFGQKQFSDRQELLRAWEDIKSEEKGGESRGNGQVAGRMDSIPDSLPPLQKAYRIHAKAEKEDFTWDFDSEQESALVAEWREWQQVQDTGSQERREQEFGDLLFSLVEHGRRKGVKANAALHLANLKFLRRFYRALQLAQDRGWDWRELDMEAKDRLWEEVKRGEQEEARQDEDQE